MPQSIKNDTPVMIIILYIGGVRLYHGVVSLASPPPHQREHYINEIGNQIKESK